MWVEHLEPSGSGTWPLAFHQSLDHARLERWVPGHKREDVSAYHNNYAALRPAAAPTRAKGVQGDKASSRVADLLEAGLVKPGDVLYARSRPDARTTVIDATLLKYEGRKWKYDDWGMHVTG
jgi:hypothetical protein